MKGGSMHTTPLVQRSALALLLLASLVGCGGSTASASPIGSTQVIGPVILDATKTSGEVGVGNMVVFNVEDPGAWTLAADPAALVELSPGGEKDGATFNPGATALAAGSVTVTLTNGTTGEVLAFSLTIK
jgi:hypothetical protein